MGQSALGLERTPIIFGARLTLFLMENLKSKAQYLAGGGADSVKGSPQSTYSGFESSVFFPAWHGAGKPMEMGSASQSGRQVEAGNQPPQSASYDLSLLF